MKRFTLPLLLVVALLTTGTIEHGEAASGRTTSANQSVLAGRTAGTPYLIGDYSQRVLTPRAARSEREKAVRPASTLSTIGLTLDFACIHRYEGAWDARTGNGYYGGLQMDATFERTYGPELLRSRGHADQWTPEQQIAVAIRAHRTRGFGPWPNTRRSCGL